MNAARSTLHASRFTFLLLPLLLCAPVCAHQRSVSYSSWEIRGRDARVTVRVTLLELSRFPWALDTVADRDRILARYLTEALQMNVHDAPCIVSDGPRALESASGSAGYEWRLRCPDGEPMKISTTLLLDVAPSHLHFARVTRDGSAPLERVLSNAERTWSLSVPGSADTGQHLGTSLGEYLVLGVGHIWTGYDHLAFLLALLLIGGSVGEVARVVTGFTVAHSITLALAALGYLRPETESIEALIGLSIALVAAENIWLLNGRRGRLPLIIAGGLASLALLRLVEGYGRVPGLTLAGLAIFAACYFELLGAASRPALLRWAIAFVFGLVHGFAFAAVLSEAHLPADRLARALLGFNVGVELGQLVIVTLAWPLLHLATRSDRGRLRAAVIEVGSAAVCGLGLFWFVTRAYG